MDSPVNSARREAPASARPAGWIGLLDASPLAIAVCRWDNDVVVAASRAFVARVGLTGTALIGRTCRSLPIWPQDAAWQRLRTELALHGQVGQALVPILGAGASGGRVALAAHLADLDGRRHLVLIVNDAGPLNPPVAAELQREHAMRLQAEVISNMAEGINLVSASGGHIVFTNPRYDAMLGYGPGELIGQPVAVVNAPTELNPQQVAERIMAELKHSGSWRGEVKNRRKDGREIWLRCTVSTFEHAEHGRVWVGVNSDITEARLAQLAHDRAHADLQRLSARSQELIEAERATLSRDVHDQLGSVFTGIRMRLEALAAQPAAQGLQADLQALARIAQTASVHTRDICSRLRPPSLDDLGLTETCRWYLAEWAATSGLTVVRRLPRLKFQPSASAAIDLFRILQELLTNVARHAAASQVSVGLSGNAQRMVLRVADNGRGFDPEARCSGFGLIGVRERVARHGGTLALQARPTGSSFTITLPRGGSA